MTLKRVLPAVLFLMLAFAGYATHNRAGEIIYKRIPPFSEKVGGIVIPVYNYSITVIKYSAHDFGSPSQIADRCIDTINFGDNTRALVPRINGGFGLDCDCGVFNNNPNQPIHCGEIITNDPDHIVKKNIYTAVHRYPGPGNYLIRVLDPNRNADVINIPRSDMQPFYIESWLRIEPTIGANSSPEFAFAPIDMGCVGQCFEHNPGAFDPDGDSLSYELTKSKGIGGEPVAGYTYPAGSYSINPVTGELRWCAPPQAGEYNLAFIVIEWRLNTNGKYEKIGYVMRDMQVIVKACDLNQPPQADVPPDTCVEAGAQVYRHIRVTDPNPADRITVQGGGAPFEDPAPVATLSPIEGPALNGGFTSTFSWLTSCGHIRKLPYQVTIKVQDNNNIEQVSFSTFNIRVVPPAIKNMTAVPSGSSIRVSWDTPFCNPPSNKLTSFFIYRRNSCDSLTFDPCNVPASLPGYTLIGKCSADTTFFVDEGGDDGLVVGQNYNYVVTAVYNDGSESLASAGVCAELRRDVPVMLNVDVDSTSLTDGVIFVRWARPLTTEGNLDTMLLPGPYTFTLFHRGPGAGEQAVFTTTANSVYGLDTAFFHTGINTTTGPHEYQVRFSAATVQVGSSQRAGSVFLKLRPDDAMIHLDWSAKTPWINGQYEIYRKDPGQSDYTMIASTNGMSYTDSAGVHNGWYYCYRVQSRGAYSDPGIYHPLLNFSQDSCIVPVDRTPPCTPTVELAADCPAGYVRLVWTDVARICGRSGDVRHYVVYHKPTIRDEYIRVAEGNFSEREFHDLAQVSGCYAVQAIDTNGNKGTLSVPFCIDNCPVFELPNVFTPNGDGANDEFKAIRVRQIRKINLKVYDRWGNMIYETTDPYFKWKGVSSISGVPCNESTYYYVCDVYEPRLSGDVIRPMKGTIHLAR